MTHAYVHCKKINEKDVIRIRNNYNNTPYFGALSSLETGPAETQLPSDKTLGNAISKTPCF